MLWNPSVVPLCVPLPHHSPVPVRCGLYTYCVLLMTAHPPSWQVLFTLREEVTALTTEPRRVAQWIAESTDRVAASVPASA